MPLFDDDLTRFVLLVWVVRDSSRQSVHICYDYNGYICYDRGKARDVDNGDRPLHRWLPLVPLTPPSWLRWFRWLRPLACFTGSAGSANSATTTARLHRRHHATPAKSADYTTHRLHLSAGPTPQSPKWSRGCSASASPPLMYSKHGLKRQT